jgi:hypothetical protein
MEDKVASDAKISLNSLSGIDRWDPRRHPRPETGPRAAHGAAPSGWDARLPVPPPDTSPSTSRAAAANLIAKELLVSRRHLRLASTMGTEVLVAVLVLAGSRFPL